MSELSQTVTIYTLADPRDGQVRYVGKTINVEQRLRRHNRPDHTRKGKWIKSLKSAGLKPTLEILETVQSKTKGDWEDVERFWIESLRQMGFRLTNLSPGGDGGNQRKESSMKPEHRAKIAAALKGKKKSAEHIENFRNSMRGHKRSHESIQKQKESNAKRTDKEKQKLKEHLASFRSLAHTPEARAKGAASRTGQKRSQETCDRIRAKAIERTSNPAWRAAHSGKLIGRKLMPEAIIKRQTTRSEKAGDIYFNTKAINGKEVPDHLWMKRYGKQVMFA